MNTYYMCIYIYKECIYASTSYLSHFHVTVCMCECVYVFILVQLHTRHALDLICVCYMDFITSTLYIICHLSCIDLIIREKEHSYTLLIFFCASKYHYTQIFLCVFLISISHNCVYSDYLCYAFPQSSILYTVSQFTKHNY